jgi:D-glucosaminate-6-phosphate ammonia-lyase
MAGMSVYRSLGVRRVINAAGIYTDLGGSVLSGAAWEAAVEANAVWASMEELLDRSGARVAELCGAPAARVVPGASAGIALAVGACVTRGDGPAMEALPLVDSVVLMQRGHEYKYARCAALAGARVEWVDDLAAALRDLPAAAPRPAAVLHPAHLDGAPGTLAIAEVAGLAAAAGVPVIVDAAFMCYPLDALRQWASAGDLACFSAKYFGGPNAAGFVAGRRERVADVAALDFTAYESGHWRTFGRAFKLDRAAVAATVAALEEWVVMDHSARLSGYAARAVALAARLTGLPVALKQFTLDEQVVDGPFVNAVVIDGAHALAERLAAGDPSLHAIVDGDSLLLCTEMLAEREIPEVAALVSAAWQDLDER